MCRSSSFVTSRSSSSRTGKTGPVGDLRKHPIWLQANIEKQLNRVRRHGPSNARVRVAGGCHVNSLEGCVRRNPDVEDDVEGADSRVRGQINRLAKCRAESAFASALALRLTTAPGCEKDTKGRFTVRASGDSHDRR